MKQTFIFILCSLYGSLMGGVALFAFLDSKISFPLLCLNFFSAILLIWACWFIVDNQILIIGIALILLILAAVFNGLALNGAVTLTHMMIRIIFSSALFYCLWRWS